MNDNKSKLEKSALPFSPNKQQKFKIVGLFIFLIAIVVTNYFIFARSAKKDEIQKESEDYKVPALQSNQILLVKNKPTISQDNFVNDQDMIKQKLAEAKAKAFVSRLQASQREGGKVITGPSSNNQTNEEKSKDSPLLSDPNTAFLVQASNSQAEHVYASHYGPLPYIIGQGKHIFATLASAINSDLPGSIEAIVSQDVYGEQGRKILIPKGSTLVGEYKSGLVSNQSRLFVVWTRVKEPSGVDIQIGSPGVDTLGRAGLTGYVDNHYIARYLSATLIAMIGAGAATVDVSSSDQYNSAAAYRQGIAQALATQASNSLSQTINIPPTINKPQGEPIVVYVNRDLDFSRVYK